MRVDIESNLFRRRGGIDHFGKLRILPGSFSKSDQLVFFQNTGIKAEVIQTMNKSWKNNGWDIIQPVAFCDCLSAPIAH